MRNAVVGCVGICVAMLETAGVHLRPAVAPDGRGLRAATAELARPQATRCSLVVASSRRLTTVDGRILHVDIQTAAVRGAEVMVAGNFAYTWAAGAAHDDPPMAGDSIIGAVVSSTGRVTLVPHPLHGRHVLHPRVATAGAAGWHVVFVVSETKDDDAGVPPSEPVALWYGLFDGRRWTQVQQVASALVRGRFWPSMGSSLVVHGRELGFAFPFGEVGGTQDSSRVSGIGLLRRRGDRWGIDTLQTGPIPMIVRLLPGNRPSGWVVAFAGSFLARDPLGRWRFDRALFAVTVGPAGWGPRRTLVASDAFLHDLEVARIGNALLVLWVELASDASPLRSSVRWATAVPETALADSAPPVDAAIADTAVAGSNEFTLASLTRASSEPEALLVARDGQRLDRVLVARLDGRTQALGLAPLNLSNHIKAKLVAVGPRRYLLFTSEVALTARRADLPPAATWAHDLRLRCIVPRR